MASINDYRAALARSTRPDLPTGRNEVPHHIERLSETDRAACVGWLRDMNFLRAGEVEDDEVWERIKRNWIGYLSATSPAPEVALAPNRKVVQFGGDGEDAREQRRRFVQDRRRRLIIQAAFYNRLDGVEAMSERWPRAARAALNSMDRGGEDEDRGAFESLAAIWNLDKRRRYQSMWTCLVGFICHSQDGGALEEMGLRLTESQIDDILDIEQEVWLVDFPAIRRGEEGGLSHVWKSIHLLLIKALRKPKSTPRNNLVVWWIAVLARSAASGDEGEGDFISRGRFHMNPMPMDVDLGERLRAMVHYSKVIVLDDAFGSWPAKERWVMEVQSRLNMVSIKWIDDKDGCRPDGPPGDGGPVYSTEAWLSVVAYIAEQTKRHLGGKPKTAIDRLRALADAMG